MSCRASGFRPFVHRLAREHGLAGWVRNDARGVLLEVEGEDAALERFLRSARRAPAAPGRDRAGAHRAAAPRPASAAFASCSGSERASGGGIWCRPTWRRARSASAELLDPGDRRHRYPFINCTNCGPRFTIVRATPYDRARTTMAGVRDVPCLPRRVRGSRPVAASTRSRTPARPAARRRAADRRERAGRSTRRTPSRPRPRRSPPAAIVAVKGVGGYHLACRADDERAVAELRRRKRREEKPFALMVARSRTRSAGSCCAGPIRGGAGERARAPDRDRPPSARARRSPTSVAPGSPDLGVMLPSTPLHHLLLDDVGTALVMTSGNVGDEPIAYRRRRRARRGCGTVADAAARPRPPDPRPRGRLGRARARSEHATRPLLLTGAPAAMCRGASQLPTAGAAAAGVRCRAEEHVLPGQGRARVGRPAHRRPAAAGRRCAASARASPTSKRCSRSSRWWSPTTCTPTTSRRGYALAREDVELIAVQHHHAHLAAVLAEHGERRAARSARSTTVQGLAATARSGAASCSCGRSRGCRVASGICSPCGFRAATRRRASRGGWHARGWWPRAAVGAACRRAYRRGRSAGSAGSRWRRWRAPGRRRPRLRAWGVCSTPWRRSAACASASREEGRAAIELEAAADSTSATPTRCRSLDGELLRLDARETVRAIVARPGRGRVAGARQRPLPQRPGRRDGRCADVARAARAPGGRRSWRAASSRTGCCSSAAPSGSRRAVCGCSYRATLPPNDGGDLLRSGGGGSGAGRLPHDRLGERGRRLLHTGPDSAAAGCRSGRPRPRRRRSRRAAGRARARARSPRRAPTA